MKILHLIESGGLYGMERILLDLVAAQIAQGDAPTIVSVGPPGAEEKAVEKLASQRGFDVKPWRMQSGFNVLGMRKILKWAKDQGTDILHAHGYRFDALLPVADPFARHKRVSTQHGLTQKRDGTLRPSQTLGLAGLRGFHKVIFVAEGLRQKYGSHLNNVVIIRNGIDIAPIQAMQKNALPPSNGRIELVAIGRLAFEKNYALLLDVIAELNQRNQPCQLTHYGDGKLRAELEEKASQLGLNNVCFAGYTDQIFEKLHAADGLIFTSRSEGMPVTVIEAMLLGLPIVSTAVGGIPEMLTDYPYGKTTTAHNPAAIADLVTEVCSASERRRVPLEILADVANRYSSVEMAKAYQCVYESI